LGARAHEQAITVSAELNERCIRPCDGVSIHRSVGYADDRDETGLGRGAKYVVGASAFQSRLTVPLYLCLRVGEEVGIPIRSIRESIDKVLHEFVPGSSAVFGTEPDISRLNREDIGQLVAAPEVDSRNEMDIPGIEQLPRSVNREAYPMR
jgi:hypothetical protein